LLTNPPVITWEIVATQQSKQPWHLRQGLMAVCNGAGSVALGNHNQQWLPISKRDYPLFQKGASPKTMALRVAAIVQANLPLRAQRYRPCGFAGWN